MALSFLDGSHACILGPELRRAEVDFDRNYGNYDELELRYLNFDNVTPIGCKNTAALC